MTETSKFWTGTGTGDAPSVRYTADQFTEAMRYLFSGYAWLYNSLPVYSGVIFTNREPYDDQLLVTNPYSNILRVSAGAALVNGSLYLNDGTVDLALPSSAPSVTETYYVCITKDWSGDYNGIANTCRATLDKITGSYTHPHYTVGTVCQTPIARVIHDTDNSITILDFRRYINLINPFFYQDQIPTDYEYDNGLVSMYSGTVTFPGGSNNTSRTIDIGDTYDNYNNCPVLVQLKEHGVDFWYVFYAYLSSPTEVIVKCYTTDGSSPANGHLVYFYLMIIGQKG